jgi:UDP-glucose 4-epimerase
VKVLVSGGAGYIGGHVVRQLADAGAVVAVVDDLSSGTQLNLRDPLDGDSVVQELFVADVTEPKLHDIVRAWAPEVIVHLAAQPYVRRSVHDPYHDARTNVLGTLNVVRAAAQNMVRKIVVASSGGAVYGSLGDGTKQAREDHPRIPISPYGVSKAAGDMYLHVYRRLSGLVATSLMLGNAFGPTAAGLLGPGVISSFATALAQGRRPVVFGDGTQARDFVHVDDIARSFVLACTAGDDERLNIGSGTAHSINEVLALVADASGVIPDPIYERAQPGEVERICLDVSRAATLLGWRPTVALSDGIGEIVERLRSISDLTLSSASTPEGC